MTVIFNGEIITSELKLSLNDRALQYGDGLFETIAIREKQPRLLDFHLDRLEAGCKLLSLNPLKRNSIRSNIDKAVKLSNLENATLKLMIWRKASELPGYSSDSDDVNWLIKTKNLNKQSLIIEKAEISTDVFFSYSPTSRYKTLNSLPYILAAQERQAKSLDELIVLNDKGMVCECVSSNIFWVTGKSVFTPKLETGCLDGVMRRFIINKLKASSYDCQEVEADAKELLRAESIFTTNSSGIRIIKKVNSTQLKTSTALLDFLTNIHEK